MKILNQATPVGKTAFDSLQAKQSAISAGYMVTGGNCDEYKEFLSKATFNWNLKRQTPLINAGYAARVQAVSQSISSFVTFHKCRHSDLIQIVLLGGGADVIGVWSHTLDPQRVVVLEVDTPELCLSKSEFLVSQKLVDGKPENSGELVGTIMSSCDRDNYFLCAVDLRDISALEAVVKTHLNLKAPTLVMTELVLSYLSPAETDALLSWCSSNLCSSPNSCFLAVEPMGCALDSRIFGPLEGYKRQYTNLFEGKMERGASSKEGPKARDPSYCPLGMSCGDIRLRFRNHGYRSIVADLGTVAASVTLSAQFCSPEVFDEHIALVLYLKSYAVAVGFSPSSEGFLQRLVCPWHFGTEIQPNISDAVSITVIEHVDEENARNLVRQVYKHRFDEYPAVRKMVSHMMSTDLATSEVGEVDSAIASRYKGEGGIFFVAVLYHGIYREREVLGCVGARRWGQNSKSTTLEVVRLAVKESYRGQGIGRRLLHMVEKFATERYETPITLIAQTVSFLDEAKLLYTGVGFSLEKESALGRELTMLTYKKILFSPRKTGL